MKIIEDIQQQLVAELLSNADICRLLYNNSAMALNEPLNTNAQFLKDRNIFDYRYVPDIQEKIMNYITMDFVTEDAFANHAITVGIYLSIHEKNMRLVDGRNRLFALSTAITDYLNKPIFQNTLPGMGRWNFMGLSGTNISPQHQSLVLLYEVVDISVFTQKSAT